MHAICWALAVVAWLAALASSGCGHNVHVRLNNGRGGSVESTTPMVLWEMPSARFTCSVTFRRKRKPKSRRWSTIW